MCVPDIEVLYEDNHLIAVNKKTSDISQPDATGDISLGEKIKLYLKKKYNKPGNVYLGTTHRIDRPVSGVVIYTKTSKALSRMNDMFKHKEVEKTYWAVVKNRPKNDEDTLENFLKKNTKQNKSYAYHKEINGSKLARLHFKIIASSDLYHLLKINLETGRHHQIRCQLSNIGCPIKGDLKYGYNHSNKNGGIHLHARHISFPHPVTTEQISITAPTPPDVLWDAFLEIMDQKS